MMNNAIVWGDIYMVDFGQSYGSEQGGFRPALIVQNNKGNMFSSTTLVCPITSQNKKSLPTHVTVTPEESGLLVKSTIMFEQLRVVDKQRLSRKVGHIDAEIVEKVMVALSENFACSL